MKIQTIGDLLADCVASAPQEKREALADALEVYAKERWRTWVTLRETPAARVILDAICEASDARIASLT